MGRVSAADPTPIAASHAGCCAGVRDGVGHNDHCRGHVLYAGLWLEPYRRRLWRVFPCAEHRELLGRPGGPVTDVRELNERDRVALQMRRERLAAALRGERWIPPRPLPEG
jgi:hypothetical protein